MSLIRTLLLAACLTAACGSPPSRTAGPPEGTAPYIVVLGTAQDGGSPQSGSHSDPAWTTPEAQALVVSLGLVDPRAEARWMFEATPDFREQWHMLDTASAVVTPSSGWRSEDRRLPDGIFLTHAHIGHYTGLMFLGHESVGASGVPVHTLPRMAEFLRSNGPWDQLVRYGNIDLRVLEPDSARVLTPRLSVTAFEVPHRQEYSDVAGFRIDGPSHSALFIPDIDSWTDWDSAGTRLESVLRTVDYAFLDATFFADGDLPGRDMSGFPHPFVATTMKRLEDLPVELRSRVQFIHLNHTNPLLNPDSDASRAVRNAGFGVARRGMHYSL